LSPCETHLLARFNGFPFGPTGECHKMTPNDYLNLICRPHVEAFASDPTCLSKAWAAVVSLGQFTDYLAAGLGISKTAARKKIKSAFPQFDLVSDVGNASKHFELHDPRRTNRPGFSIGHLKIGKSAAFSDGSFFSDGSSFAEHPNVVRADFANEHTDMVHLCKTCLACLETVA